MPMVTHIYEKVANFSETDWRTSNRACRGKLLKSEAYSR
jgi:hypothetical protein